LSIYVCHFKRDRPSNLQRSGYAPSRHSWKFCYSPVSPPIQLGLVVSIFLVLFAGGLNSFSNYPRYQNDLTRLGTTLLSRSGFAPAQTTILFAQGGTVFNLGNGISLTALLANADNLKATFSQIGAAGKSSSDSVLFIASNHGGQDAQKTGSTLWGWGTTPITDQDFTQFCDLLGPLPQVFVLGQCYSGGFIRPLGRSGRCIMTASAWDQPSYATADAQYDEFLLLFSQYIEAGGDSLAGAFSYISTSDNQQETPQFYDGGLGGETFLLGQPPAQPIYRGKIVS